ncbi:MAG: ABC transporter substrate-binding protein [Alphaproteobacteria bacterium]|nr:ABC transporter substrate-binding protein [Alphaproteobacteria bacterium]
MRTRLVSLLAAAAITLPVAVQAKELRVGYTSDALTLDPHNHRNRLTQTVIRNMYDGLVTRDPNMKVVPQLAEYLKVIDKTTYEVKLQAGATFHDGTPITAEDVKYTFERLTKDGAIGGKTSPRKSLTGPIDAVNVIDDRTVRIVLKTPWPQFPAFLTLHEIVSKTFTEAQGADGLATKVMGSGPFKLAAWRKGDSVIMERHDGYYGGSPALAPKAKACSERVIFKIIPENASRVAALLSGDVDLINDLPAHAVNQVKNNPDTDVMTVNGTRSYFIALNNQSGPFKDIRVRQALGHAIDRKLIIDRIMNGNGTPIDGILSPDAFGKNMDLPPLAYDPKKARSLLAAAGYPKGVEVVLDVKGELKEIAEAIGSLLTKAGFRTTIQVGEVGQLRKKWRTKGKPKTGDMWLTSWGNGTLDPVGIFVPTHRTNDRGNSAGYANPELDAILDAAGVEPDAEKRAAMYQKAELIAAKDSPYAYLWVTKDLYGVSKRLTGFRPSSDGRINLHDACVK